MPVLIHHYLEHDEDDAHLSFFQFLHEHYNEHHDDATKSNDHENLPFKSHDLGFSQTTLAYQPLIAFEFKTDKLISAKENIIYSSAFHPTSIASRIWQPPKSC